MIDYSVNNVIVLATDPNFTVLCYHNFKCMYSDSLAQWSVFLTTKYEVVFDARYFDKLGNFSKRIRSGNETNWTCENILVYT